ncbi:hypothetical protein JCM11251_007685 [Rhodosporidiobolus azoricus]
MALNLQHLTPELTILALGKLRNPASQLPATDPASWPATSPPDEVEGSHLSEDSRSSRSGHCPRPEPPLPASNTRQDNAKTQKSLLAEEYRLFGLYSYYDEDAYILDWPPSRRANLFKMNGLLRSQMEQHAFVIVPNEATCRSILAAFEMFDRLRTKQLSKRRSQPFPDRDVSAFLQVTLDQLGLVDPLYTCIVLRPELMGSSAGSNSDPYVQLAVPVEPDDPYSMRQLRSFSAANGQLIDAAGHPLRDFVHRHSRTTGDELHPVAFALSAINKVWRFERADPLGAAVWNGPDFSPRTAGLVVLLTQIALTIFRDPLVVLVAPTPPPKSPVDLFLESHPNLRALSQSSQALSPSEALPFPSPAQTVQNEASGGGREARRGGMSTPPIAPIGLFRTDTGAGDVRQKDSIEDSADGSENRHSPLSLSAICNVVLQTSERGKMVLRAANSKLRQNQLDHLFHPASSLGMEDVKTIILNEVLPCL